MSISDILAKKAAQANADQANIQSGLGTSANMFPKNVLSPDQLLATVAEPVVHVDPGTGQTFLGSVSATPEAKAIWPDGTNGGMEVPADADGIDIPEGAFLPIRLKRFVDQNGVWVNPKEDGFFWPANEWEENELRHFETQYAMVKGFSQKSEETQ